MIASIQNMETDVVIYVNAAESYVIMLMGICLRVKKIIYTINTVMIPKRTLCFSTIIMKSMFTEIVRNVYKQYSSDMLPHFRCLHKINRKI